MVGKEAGAASVQVEKVFKRVGGAEKFGKCGPGVAVKGVGEVSGVGRTSHIVGVVVISEAALK